MRWKKVQRWEEELGRKKESISGEHGQIEL